MENNKKLEQMIAELNQLQQQGEAIANQVEQLNLSLTDIKSASEALKGIEGSVGKELLIPVGAGCFINAELKSEDIIVGVGAEVAVKKSREETVEKLEKETKEVQELITTLTNQLDKINEMIATQRPEAERLMRESGLQ
ncbi:prefoldin subunit alpha [Methanosphaera cuniculi]|uniref:prefoldin subunit alpha n=1 Tax=Methanosphaera cuniculi TaxID=1077256 RepID=UPI0026DD9D11|nr:prefoldin subunit alpha [Methanosphaera cuniculi]